MFWWWVFGLFVLVFGSCALALNSVNMTEAKDGQ